MSRISELTLTRPAILNQVSQSCVTLALFLPSARLVRPRASMYTLVHSCSACRLSIFPVSERKVRSHSVICTQPSLRSNLSRVRFRTSPRSTLPRTCACPEYNLATCLLQCRFRENESGRDRMWPAQRTRNAHSNWQSSDRISKALVTTFATARSGYSRVPAVSLSGLPGGPYYPTGPGEPSRGKCLLQQPGQP